jgi:ApbE superfamily uncharacterized protein (UPF0280 family)
MQAQRHSLDDQRQRWCHGPIDLIIQAEGHPEVVAAAQARAWAEFQHLLSQLVQELPLLRQPVQAGVANPFKGEVARSMWQACQPFAGAGEKGFITPMAAVAGAVAQQVLRHHAVPGILRASVNNGGDIALHLAAGQRWRLGVVSDIASSLPQIQDPLGALPDAAFDIDADAGVAGVATSGWSGRSFSLGIADSVTVLAATAAQADAAATMIANQVNTEHPGIIRQPANQVRDDTDLGDRAVTRHVPPLPLGQIMTALQRGLAYAQDLRRRGLISAALLVCQQQSVVCGQDLGLLVA